jgi:hypothetical protein
MAQLFKKIIQQEASPAVKRLQGQSASEYSVEFLKLVGIWIHFSVYGVKKPP